MSLKKEKNNVNYVLTLSSDQAKTLSKACDIYSRLLMGQWDRLAEQTFDWSHSVGQDMSAIHENYNKVLSLLTEARDLAMNGFKGVGYSSIADSIYGVHQVLRNKIAWTEHPEGGWTVDFDKPISFCGEELVDCKVQKDEVE